MNEIDITYGALAREMTYAIDTGAAHALGEAIAFGFAESMKSYPRHDPLAEAVRVLNKDPHDYSMRPCPTCTAMTAALGEPFGCVAKVKAKHG